MGKNNNRNRFLQFFIGSIVAILFVACLFVDNIFFVWIVIGLLFFDALYLATTRGLRWWKGNQSKFALRERFLTFLISLMFLFLVTGTALFMKAFFC